ncbi:hypothetical protein DL96DRAFT_623377 [Flagelloscypha sp. PMI_526]|nr:hypothetical protein DL96DRAFT_623377 [Flagelloscypha sp. PMI_526]
MSVRLNIFQRAVHRMRYWSHEQPVMFYSVVLGGLGPLMVVTIPPIRRKYFGYVAPEPIPTSYPLPNRPRVALTGYDDPE